MNVFGLIRCLLLPHAVNRRRVKTGGQAYTSKCQACGAPIKRISRDRWVRDWRATLHLRASPPKPPSAEDSSSEARDASEQHGKRR
jgi:hypothetical protein